MDTATAPLRRFEVIVEMAGANRTWDVVEARHAADAAARVIRTIEDRYDSHGASLEVLSATATEVTA